MSTGNDNSTPPPRPHARVPKQAAFDAIQKAREAYVGRPERFLTAWKRGVLIAGAYYFDILGDESDDWRERVRVATDKNQLRPKLAIIDESIGPISRGEGAFLAAMYSFFNSDDGQRLLEKSGFPNICDLAGKLDDDRAAVIAELFLSYNGW